MVVVLRSRGLWLTAALPPRRPRGDCAGHGGRDAGRALPFGRRFPLTALTREPRVPLSCGLDGRLPRWGQVPETLRKGRRIRLSPSPAPGSSQGILLGGRGPETELTHRVLPSELLSGTSPGGWKVRQ